jgi:hypothetical protein
VEKGQNQTLALGSPSEIRIIPNKERTVFLFRLTFRERPPPIEFMMDDAGAMLLLHGLKELQAKYKIPIPDQVRPRGKPKLRVVTSDE